MSDDLASVSGEMKEKFEFFRRKVQRAAHHFDAVGRGVDDKVACADGGFCALGGAAQMSTYASKEFLNAEWLGYVVVGAGVEGLDLGAFVIAHGEDQHGCG